MMRLLLLPLAALLLGGCSLFGGDSYDDLALGTCEFRAGGNRVEGVSDFISFQDSQVTEARVTCVRAGEYIPGSTPFLTISSDSFFDVSEGDFVTPESGTYNNGAMKSYRFVSGEVEIERVSGSRVGGRFRFQMRYSPFSGGSAETITVEGGFYADTAE